MNYKVTIYFQNANDIMMVNNIDVEDVEKLKNWLGCDDALPFDCFFFRDTAIYRHGITRVQWKEG